MNDIFCRIIAGEIPSAKVYEDEDVLAILDISQTTPGHTLVMPKAHCGSMLDCPQEILTKVMNVAQKVANAAKEALGADGVNILANCGEEAGQTVPHFHVHVLPRYKGKKDGLCLAFESHDVDMSSFPELAKRLGEAMK